MPFALLNGARLWYDDWPGKMKGPPLLFHHGYTAYRRNVGYDEGGMAWLLSARGYRCIFIEARGCGSSRGAPGPHSAEQYARDSLALMDHLALETVTFVGHSFGALVGCWLGLRHPGRLAGLVLLAPAPGAWKGPPPAVASHVTAETGFARAQPTRDDEAVELARYRRDAARIPAGAASAATSSERWIRDRVEQRRGCDPGHYHGVRDELLEARLGAELPNLHLDVLMICGAHDSLLPANLADYGRLPRAVLCVLPWTGHEVPVEQPERCAQEIARFLAVGAVSSATLSRL